MRTIALRQGDLAAAEGLMREIIVNQRNQNSRLVRENQLLRKQNGRLRSALRHVQEHKHGDPCSVCASMIREALGEAIP